MIRYKKYQFTGENHPLKGLWYARPVIEETFDTVVTTEEKELLYGALNFAGLANGHVAMADQDSEADQP